MSPGDACEIESRWGDLSATLAYRFPRATELMLEATEDVLAYSWGEDFVYRHFPSQHWSKIWSTKPLDHLNEEVKYRIRVVGIIHNDAAITRLVATVLLVQDKH